MPLSVFTDERPFALLVVGEGHSGSGAIAFHDNFAHFKFHCLESRALLDGARNEIGLRALRPEAIGEGVVNGLPVVRLNGDADGFHHFPYPGSVVGWSPSATTLARQRQGGDGNKERQEGGERCVSARVFSP